MLGFVFTVGITAPASAKLGYLPSLGMNFHPSLTDWTYQLMRWGGRGGEIISDIAALSAYPGIYCHRNARRGPGSTADFERLWGNRCGGEGGAGDISGCLMERLLPGLRSNGGDNLSLIPHNHTK